MREQAGPARAEAAGRTVAPFGAWDSPFPISMLTQGVVGLTEALRTELVGDKVGVSLVLPGVVDTPMVETANGHPDSAGLWPRALNMPADWVVWAIFAAARFRLAEVAVPPGSALVEKLAALAPGTTDVFLRGLMDIARRPQRRRT